MGSLVIGFNTTENALRIASPVITTFTYILTVVAILAICLYITRIAIDVIYIIIFQDSSINELDKIKNISSLKGIDEYISIWDYLKRFFVRNFAVLVLAILLFSGQATGMVINLAYLASSGIDALIGFSNDTIYSEEDGGYIREIQPGNIYFNTEEEGQPTTQQ